MHPDYEKRVEARYCEFFKWYKSVVIGEYFMDTSNAIALFEWHGPGGFLGSYEEPLGKHASSQFIVDQEAKQ